MIKKCYVCNHVGELTWRDGKYYCAMCGSEVSEKEPVVQYQNQYNPPASEVTCHICKNREDNLFDGKQYRCALCGATIDVRKEDKAQSHRQTTDASTTQVKTLKKKKDKYLIWGIVFVCLFWPVSIYFFYKFYQTGKELKAIELKELTF